jgi:hypothetical protein
LPRSLTELGLEGRQRDRPRRRRDRGSDVRSRSRNGSARRLDGRGGRMPWGRPHREPAIRCTATGGSAVGQASFLIPSIPADWIERRGPRAPQPKLYIGEHRAARNERLGRRNPLSGIRQLGFAAPKQPTGARRHQEGRRQEAIGRGKESVGPRIELRGWRKKLAGSDERLSRVHKSYSSVNRKNPRSEMNRSTQKR